MPRTEHAEAADERLRELYRAAGPTAKLAAVARINSSLIAVKEAALLRQHPDSTPAQRRSALHQWWFSARD